MNDDLPSDHDVIIIGTGMTESILAAAFSRAEMRVLHMDMYDNYGGKWGAFNFKTFQELINDNCETPLQFEPAKDLVIEGDERSIELPNTHNIISNPQQFSIKTTKKQIDEEGASGINKVIVCAYSDDNDEIRNSDEGKSIINVGNVLVNNKNGEDKNKFEDDINEDVDNSSKEDSARAESGAIAGDGGIKREVKEDAKKDIGQNIGEGRIVDDEDGGDGNDDGGDGNDDGGDGDDDDDGDGGKEDAFEHSMEDINAQWRRFNLDLLPKVLYNKGSLVELLISSDVARYCEFKLLNRILTPMNNKLVPVPSSRSEVFSTDCVSLLDKRQLMKFLTSVSQPPHLLIKGHEATPFKDFLPTLNLSPTLQHFIQHAIAMVDDQSTTLEGIEATRRYLDSLGRYDGNSSFLVPLYGTAELLQCFCRLSAVFGGIYCLRRTVAAIIVDHLNNIKCVVDSKGQRLTTKWLVMDSSYACASLFKLPAIKSSISRAILITNMSVDPSKKDALTLCNIPGGDNDIIMHEMSSSSMLCPPNYYVVHLTCKSAKGGREDFDAFITQYFHHPQTVDSIPDSIKPTIIWSSFFTIDSITCGESNINNIILINGPDSKLDCDSSVSEAESVFKRVCPDLIFLPRAPRPEEIIYGYDDDAKKDGTDDDAKKDGTDDDAKKDGTDDDAKKDGTDDDAKKDGTDDDAKKDSDDNNSKKDGDDDGIKKDGDGNDTKKDGDDDDSKKDGDDDDIKKGDAVRKDIVVEDIGESVESDTSKKNGALAGNEGVHSADDDVVMQ